jgi:hypothetical protein
MRWWVILFLLGQLQIDVLVICLVFIDVLEFFGRLLHCRWSGRLENRQG